MSRSMVLTTVITALLVACLPARVLGFGDVNSFGGGSGAGAGGGGIVSVEDSLQEAIHAEEAEGDLDGAIATYRDLVETYRSQQRQADKLKPVAVTAMLRLAAALEKQGRKGEAIGQYIALTEEFGDASEATEARKRLAALGIQLPASAEPGMSLEARLKTIIKAEADPPANLTFKGLFAHITSDSGVNIVIDQAVPSGPLGSEPLGAKLKGLSVEGALNIITKASSFPLDWTIYSGAAYVGPPDKIAKLEAEEEAKATPQLAYLRDEVKLLEEKLETARRGLEVFEKERDAGRADDSSVNVVRDRVIAVLRELREAQGKLDAARQHPVDGVVAVGRPAVVEVKPSGGDDSESAFRGSLGDEPGVTDLILYRPGLLNFTGPQGLDLDSGKTCRLEEKNYPKAAPEEASAWEKVDYAKFFVDNPECDILFINSWGRGEPTSFRISPQFLVRGCTKVAELARYATIDTLPDAVEHLAPAAPGEHAGPGKLGVDESGTKQLTLRGQRFVFDTGKGEYFVQATPRQAEGSDYIDRAFVAYMRIPRELPDWRDPEARRQYFLQKQSAEATNAAMAREQGAEASVPDGLLASRLRVDINNARNSLEMRYPGIKWAELYPSGVKNFTGPQALDLHTGKTAPVPQGELDTFLVSHPEYDMLYRADSGSGATSGKSTGQQLERDERISRMEEAVVAREQARTERLAASARSGGAQPQPRTLNSGPRLALNKGVEVALIPDMATFESLPDVLEYETPGKSDGVFLSRGGSPCISLRNPSQRRFVIRAARALCLVVVTKMQNMDVACIAYMPLPGRGVAAPEDASTVGASPLTGKPSAAPATPSTDSAVKLEE